MDLSEIDSSTSCDDKKPKRTQFMCPFDNCEASFAKHSKVLHHVRKHTGERPYVCDETNCTKAYTNSSHLRRHKAMVHTKKDKVICTHPGCKLEFYNLSNMKRHVARVHDENRKFPYMCDKCNKGFCKKRLLQKHMFVHTGVLGFECSVCNMRFAITTDLTKHKRTHTTYTCECGEQYERWTALMKHKRETHKPDTTCSECGKKFADINILRQHKKKIHIPLEKMTVFQCPRDGCVNTYMYKKNLKEHIKYFHDKKPKKKIPCPIEDCGAFLSRMQCLKKHLEVHKTGIVRKVNRATRWDAGIPKKSTASELSGIPLSHSQNRTLLNQEHITVTPDIQTDFEERDESEETETSESEWVPSEEHENPEISGDLNDTSDNEQESEDKQVNKKLSLNHAISEAGKSDCGRQDDANNKILEDHSGLTDFVQTEEAEASVRLESEEYRANNNSEAATDSEAKETNSEQQVNSELNRVAEYEGDEDESEHEPQYNELMQYQVSDAQKIVIEYEEVMDFKRDSSIKT